EIVWRFMKYDWIENAAYENWRSLKKHVEKVLTGFGKEFVINFA
ncbi:MAG: IS630 family transposase, partial [Pseudanabaenales cyanobacterium]|nr:IS630 family transposase [Pseudanabaenales cyanobacterium]